MWHMHLDVLGCHETTSPDGYKQVAKRLTVNDKITDETAKQTNEKFKKII